MTSAARLAICIIFGFVILNILTSMDKSGVLGAIFLILFVSILAEMINGGDDNGEGF